MKRTRFEKPLGADTPRGSFAMPGGMGPCIDEMATARGISTAELLRRVVARAIVADSPVVLSELPEELRSQLERLAAL